MLSLCKCHLVYLLNKVFVYIFLIVIGFNFIFDLIILINMPDNLTYKEETAYYYSSINQIMRLELLVVNSIISSFSFQTSIDQYRSILVPSGVSRSKYFFTKYLTIFLVSFSVVVIVNFEVLLLGLIFRINIDSDFFYSVLGLIISTLYFEGIGVILLLLTDNFYMVLVLIVLILFTSVDIGDNGLKYFIMFINEDNHYLMNLGYYFIFDILLFFIGLLIYQKKDLQT